MGTNEARSSVVQLAWQEPIVAYEKLRSANPLLLDGMGNHPDARFAYLALAGRLDVRQHADRWALTHDDGTVESRTGLPLEVLGDILREWQFDSKEDGFTGGFVGYFGYEFTQAIEPTLQMHASPTPNVMLRLCRDVVVFDRETKTASLWTTDLPGESGAKDRQQAWLTMLGAPASLPSNPDRLTTWTPSMDEQTFSAAVERVRELVRTGDLFQANIATQFQADWTGDPVALYDAIRRANPSPYMALMDWGDHAIVSNSPEQLFGVDDDVIRARPIAGTRPRDADPSTDEAFEQELLTDAKEQAEHTMLLDLLRNDVARVSAPGTVRVSERGSVERYQRVMHLVSCVEGQIREGTQFIDWLAALFPGGTITGAPKHRACMRIQESEPVARGPYTGSAGFLSWDQTLTQWNIMIRTMVLQGGHASVHAGSGIVAGSQPEREWQEAGHKARALLETASRATAEPMSRVGDVTPHGRWWPPGAAEQVSARVLLIDNYDSFVYNLADYCAALGADVRVVRNDADLAAAREEFQPTHVILSPGPGWPADAGATPTVARDWLGTLPILGVCLGHQALAEAAGAKVAVSSRPVHGETDSVQNLGGTLHDGLPSAFNVARYHSLSVEGPTLPTGWQVTSTLADGTIMSMENQQARAFGLQYHPESVGTPHGLDILIRFLKTQ